MTNYFDNIHVIINPASGQAEPILSTINRVFDAHSANWSVSITHSFGDGKRLAQQAIKNGADLIAVYGGDGTIVDVVNGVAETDVPLAVLPGGTGNGIAKEFELPLKLAEATEAIFTYPIVPIDLGYTDKSYYILRLDIGIIADVVSNTPPEMKGRWGAMAYLMSTATRVNQPKHTYTLEFDSGKETIEGIGCIVTNANKIGALHFGFNEYVRIDDGLLDVIIMTDVGNVIQNVATSLIQLSPNVAVNLHHWQSKSVRISLEKSSTVLADGERIGQTPIYTEVRHNALQVIKKSSKS